jgi:hypothetical protein
MNEWSDITTTSEWTHNNFKNVVMIKHYYYTAVSYYYYIIIIYTHILQKTQLNTAISMSPPPFVYCTNTSPERLHPSTLPIIRGWLLVDL